MARAVNLCLLSERTLLVANDDEGLNLGGFRF